MHKPLCDGLGQPWDTAGYYILSKIATTPDRGFKEESAQQIS